MANVEESKYCFILGTRAELIKTAPVMQELDERNISFYFISTGQHDLSVTCEIFNIKQPDMILTPPPTTSSKFNSNQKKALWWNFKLYFKIQNAMRKLKKVKYVLYHGDTMTTCTAAVATSNFFYPLKKWKNVHLEAGLRSHDYKEPFPEELSRVIADRFSDILFAPSDLSMLHLAKYNSKKKHLVGNTILDSANYAFKIAHESYTQKMNPRGEFALITVHRHENIKNKERLGEIVDALKNLKYTAFFMVHSNTRKKLEEFDLWQPLLDNANLILCEPLEYSNFIYLLGGGKCKLVICDGGSMQEECMLFKVPCVVLRKKTERQEACDSGWQRLTNVESGNITEAIEYYISGAHTKDYPNPINPYGKVGVSSKIIDILEQ